MSRKRVYTTDKYATLKTKISTSKHKRQEIFSAVGPGFLVQNYESQQTKPNKANSSHAVLFERELGRSFLQNGECARELVAILE